MSASVDARMDLPRAMPALLIRTVGGPRDDFMLVVAEAMDGGEARSQW